MNSNNLKKILHINTITKHATSQPKLDQLNSTINNNISPNYKLKKYLGTGFNNSKIYLATDRNDTQLVCQITTLPKKHKGQLMLELSILDILSKNRNTAPYINKYIDYNLTQTDNNIIAYTMFPLNTGYKLNNLKGELVKLNKETRKYISKAIIKSILQAVSAIHKRNIAHQNLDDTSIIVSHTPSFEEKTKAHNLKIKVKLVDFALSCGVYKSNNNMKFEKCLMMTNDDKVELENNTKSMLKSLSNTEQLNIAQMNDVKDCGVIFSNLLNVEDGKVDKDIKPYYDVINNFMTVELDKRISAKDCLEKILTNEKYGNKNEKKRK
jgi:hypothetical protein